jgi:hypothetical protein
MERTQGVAGHAGEDTDYSAKRLEGAGLVVPVLKGGPPGAGIVHSRVVELTPALTRLIELLRSGRKAAGGHSSADEDTDGRRRAVLGTI